MQDAAEELCRDLDLEGLQVLHTVNERGPAQRENQQRERADKDKGPEIGPATDIQRPWPETATVSGHGHPSAIGPATDIHLRYSRHVQEPIRGTNP